MVNRLRGSDLQTNYFNPGAIETQGIDPRSVYAIELPEGFYTLKVQAFEAATGQVVSNVSETYMVLAYPQPPILNLPLVGSEVPVTSLQKVPISWAPRHFASPNTQAVYHLQVCEVPDEFDPTELVMLTCTEPRLDVTVPTTSYAADITQWIKPLEVGKRYAVQVSVTDLSGELTNFVNQGRSQVSWFRYGKECSPPVFSIQSLGTDRVQLSWERTEGAQGYVVEYKLATAANWQTMLVSGTSQVIGSLNPTADYLFRMRTDCGGSSPSAASEIQPWNIRDEAPDVAPELPLALTNPIAIRVQTGVDGQTQIPTSLSALYSNYPRPAGGSSDPVNGTATGGSSSTSGTTTQGVVNDPGSTTGSVATSAQPGSSTSSTGTTPTGTGLPLFTLPYCAMQASSFAGCEIPLPTVGLPTGDRELTSLSVGDVLGIYDYAVFVTKVGESTPGGGSPLSGEGLARLPFLNGTMVLVEFSGIQAKAGEPGTNGGCVYAVPESGYFRIKRATQAEVLAQQRNLIASLVSQQTSTTTTPGTSMPGSSTSGVPFVGTLGEALAKYDSVVVGLHPPTSQTLSVATRQALIQYTAAIGQGSESIKTSFESVYGGNRDPLVIGIRDSLGVLINQVNQTFTALQSGSSVAGLSVLRARYEALFAQVNKLTNPTTTTPILPNISPVALSKLTDNSATLNWQGDPSFTKYVVHYKLENGGELLQTVTSPSIKLLNLQAGSNYTYTIEGYQGTNLVSSYQAPFTTVSTEVPSPQNLAYTVQDDNTLTISWDKNSLYKGYKLVYKDLAGVERTVYPTTNQVKLTGLDPTQSYTYQLVGYTSTNESSAPTGGRVASGPTCALGIDDRNATNSASITTDEHLLLAIGCIGGKLSWSNGTPGTVTNNIITWADGETGQLGGIFLGDHALVVDPRKNTTYTAICQLGSGSTQKSCTYSIELKVSSPECQGDFQITASATSIEKGDVVTLTASGCNGQLTWSQGLGTAPTLRLVPVTDMIVWAICTNAAVTCYAHPVPINLKKITTACIGRLYMGKSEISKKCFLWDCRTVHDIKVYFTGCDGGNVSWTTTGDLRGGLEPASNYAQLKDIQGPFTVSAVCQPANTDLPACPAVTLSYNDNCLSNYYVLTSSSNGLSGSIVLPDKPGFTPLYMLSQAEDRKMLLYDEANTLYNPTPDPVMALYVPVSAKDKTYTAVVPPLGCTATLTVPGRVSTPPSILWTELVNKGSSTKVGGAFSSVTNSFDLRQYSGYNPTYRLLMTVSNCPGKLVWTNDQNPTSQLEANRLDFSDANAPTVSSDGLAYLNFPAVTTTYYATCTITNPDGSQEVYQAANPKTIVITSDACMRIDVETPSVTKGQPVKMRAVGCPGDVSWSTPEKMPLSC